MGQREAKWGEGRPREVKRSKGRPRGAEGGERRPGGGWSFSPAGPGRHDATPLQMPEPKSSDVHEDQP